MKLIDLSFVTLTTLTIPPETNQDGWKHLHHQLLYAKKSASKWLQQSRDFAENKWGSEWAGEQEFQIELDLGLALPEAKPTLNPADKTKAIVTIEGLSQSFILWQRKMSDEIQGWDKDRLNRALELLEPMEREAKRVRELLAKV